jgi:putative redox protein
MESNIRHAVLTWTGGLRFSGGAPDRPTLTLDGDGDAGPSPMITLLLALGSCTGADVVLILEKMRAGLSQCRIEVTGTRQVEHPQCYTAITLRFHLTGAALDEAKARRAIELSLEKYCSIAASLAPDIAIISELVLG